MVTEMWSVILVTSETQIQQAKIVPPTFIERAHDGRLLLLNSTYFFDSALIGKSQLADDREWTTYGCCLYILLHLDLHEKAINVSFYFM